MEKNKNNTFKEIWNKIKNSKKVIIPLHPKPDGDSFGSCVAMKYVLEREDIQVKLVSRDEVSEDLKEYDFVDEVEFGTDLEELEIRRYDLIILLDYGSLNDYSKDFKENEEIKEKIINIDHHETNSYYGNLNYVDKNAPSCASILVEFFKKLNIEFDEELARRLLLGILTDTDFFINGDSLNSMKHAVFLMEKGQINYYGFVKPIIKKSWKLKKLIGVLVNNMEKREIDCKNILSSYIKQEDIEKYELNASEIRLGINFLKDVKDIDIIFTLSEFPEKIKGSFRSFGIDTSVFSKEFGGGGHKKASAFYIEKMPIEKAKEKVFEVIEKVGIHKISE